MPGTTISDARTYYSLTDCTVLATTSANVLWNYRNVGNMYKVNSVRLVNFSGGTVTVTLNIYDASTNTIVRLAKDHPVSAKTVNVFSNVNTSLILDEGDVLSASCSANNSINIIVNYDLFSDLLPNVMTSRYSVQSINGNLV